MLKLFLFASIMMCGASAHAQRSGIDRYMDDMARLAYEGKNVPIKPGVVLCLVPNSVSPANAGYTDPQLKSLGCFRTPRQLTGFVVRVHVVGHPYPAYIGQIQIPLPDNSIQTVWAYVTDL